MPGRALVRCPRSVLRQNLFGKDRIPTESAIAASLLGLVPEYGVLLDENRKGSLRVEVTADLTHPTDWGALGYFAGKEAGLGIPVFNGCRRPSQDEAKQLCSTLATSGGVTMAHIVGVTPEARTLEDAFQDEVPEGKILFDNDTLRAQYESLRQITGDEVDACILGCPRASIRELAEIAHLLRGKKVADGVRLWVDTARGTKGNADAMATRRSSRMRAARSSPKRVRRTCESQQSASSRTVSSRRTIPAA